MFVESYNDAGKLVLVNLNSVSEISAGNQSNLGGEKMEAVLLKMPDGKTVHTLLGVNLNDVHNQLMSRNQTIELGNIDPGMVMRAQEHGARRI